MSGDQENYRGVIQSLADRGIRAEFHGTDQLVLPSRVWITWKEQWFISTWTPAIYPVPEEVDIVEVCLACLASEPSPFYVIPDDIVKSFGLRRLDENEVEQLFIAMGPRDEEYD